jgi:hypothetical protein
MAFAKLAQAGYTKYLVQQKLNSVEAGNEINVQVDRDKMASRTISADSGYDDANRLVEILMVNLELENTNMTLTLNTMLLTEKH